MSGIAITSRTRGFLIEENGSTRLALEIVISLNWLVSNVLLDLYCRPYEWSLFPLTFSLSPFPLPSSLPRSYRCTCLRPLASRLAGLPQDKEKKYFAQRQP